VTTGPKPSVANKANSTATQKAQNVLFKLCHHYACRRPWYPSNGYPERATWEIDRNPTGAVIILLLVAMSATAVALISTGGASLAAVVSAPKYLFLGGFFVAFYMLSITAISPTAITPHFGIGNAVSFVLLGQ
jgi:hypothetical protein